MPMAVELNVPRSRRAILAGALGGAAAIAAQALGQAAPVAAATGDIVHVGDNLTGTTFTKITNTAGGDAIIGSATGSSGKGVTGLSADNTGVFGQSTLGPGVAGLSTSNRGVLGQSLGSTEAGVDGNAYGGNTGVYGHSGTGYPDSPVKTGVFGYAEQDSSSRGVHGMTPAGQGVRGEATETGVGVYATAPATGVALQAAGKVKFSRSGKSTMAAGTSTKTITLAGVTTASLVFAILASNRSGRYVRAVVASAGSFKIYLNTTVLSSTSVSWFVLN